MKQLFVAFTLTVGIITAGEPVCAADPAPTTISIPDLHCASCAKKVTTRLTTLAGVEKAEADVKAKTITVTPKVGALLSPKAVWEAVELAEQVPTKLSGPSGTFTSKPKS